jgi:eukaryotic-like serine/threonine-protein kinase
MSQSRFPEANATSPPGGPVQPVGGDGSGQGSSTFRPDSGRQAPLEVSVEGADSSAAPGSVSTSPDDRTVISSRPPVEDPSSRPLASTHAVGQSLVGTRLEHFELLEFVGGGGMGSVFRAADTRLDRTVAVKVLSRDHTDEETIRRFGKEAQSAARLDHPNIARVHYVGEDRGWNFIVFEYIEGVNLRDYVVQHGPLPLEDALIYTLYVAEALAHSSSRDVIHRDIKPSNVLVTADGTVKLVDMGLARLHQVETSSDDLTSSGVTLGTFDYISPEQARDPRLADVRSDIYSLGCTLYYLLAGRPPFPDGTALQKLLRHNADQPADIRVDRPDLPAEAQAILARMLAKRPDQRQQSAEQLIAEIVALADQLGLARIQQRGHVVVSESRPAEQPWNRLLQVTLAGLIVVALIVVLDRFAPHSAPESVVLQPARLAPAPVDKTAGSTPALPVPVGPVEVGTPPDQWAAGAAQNSPTARPAAEIASSGASASRASPAGRSTTPEPGSAALPTETDTTAPVERPASIPTTASTALSAPLLSAPELTSSEIGPPLFTARLDAINFDPELLAAIGPAPPGALPSPDAKISRIVVAAELPAEPVAGQIVETSLAAASRQAAELGLTEIELAWSGPLEQAPFELTSGRLVLRAAAGFRPEIVFQPEVSLSGASQEMIRLTGSPGNRLTIQETALTLRLPDDPASGWSLLSLQVGQTLELRDAVLTVQDGDEQTPPRHDQVAMIAVRPRPMSDTMTMDPMAAMSLNTGIVLERTIARGEATFIRLSEDVPLELRWNQGLLITPKRLLETTGSSANPRWFDRINLSLERVTAVCRQGLFQVKRRSGAAYQFGVEVDASNCIFLTDSQAPLYDFVNVNEVTTEDLHCDGSANRYPQPDVTFLRVRPPSPLEPDAIYSLKQRGEWSMESQPQPRVPWKTPPTLTLPAHRQVREAFELQAEAEADAGFDPALVPEFPALVEPQDEGIPPEAADPFAASGTDDEPFAP